MKRSKTKRAAQLCHAQRRARERFGLNASIEQLEQIAKDIQAQKATFIERQSLRVTVWEIEIEELRVVVVYDSQRKSVVTMIPKDWWENNGE